MRERKREQHNVLVIYEDNLSNFDNSVCRYLRLIIIAEIESLVIY